MILLIDNYDSFTFNLYQLIEELGYECLVKRNDQIDVEGIHALNPESIILSPGPGAPKSAGIVLDVIKEFAGRTPIFGVCLGHQAIGEAFGGKVVGARRPRHGKVSRIKHNGHGLFAGLPQMFNIARYHSLVVEENSLPSCLEITARAEDGQIMGLRHKVFSVEGVQFHPESVATQFGRQLIANVLRNHFEQKSLKSAYGERCG